MRESEIAISIIVSSCVGRPFLSRYVRGYSGSSHQSDNSASGNKWEGRVLRASKPSFRKSISLLPMKRSKPANLRDGLEAQL